MTERIFAVLHVSVMGLTRCYKTTVFLTCIDKQRRLDILLGGGKDLLASCEREGLCVWCCRRETISDLQCRVSVAATERPGRSVCYRPRSRHVAISHFDREMCRSGVASLRGRGRPSFDQHQHHQHHQYLDQVWWRQLRPIKDRLEPSRTCPTQLPALPGSRHAGPVVRAGLGGWTKARTGQDQSAKEARVTAERGVAVVIEWSSRAVRGGVGLCRWRRQRADVRQGTTTDRHQSQVRAPGLAGRSENVHWRQGRTRAQQLRQQARLERAIITTSSRVTFEQRRLAVWARTQLDAVNSVPLFIAWIIARPHRRTAYIYREMRRIVTDRVAWSVQYTE